MKFYGNGIIWDSVKNKVLCKFDKGILETEDTYICDRLKELDYKHDEVIIKEVEKPKAKRKR